MLNYNDLTRLQNIKTVREFQKFESVPSGDMVDPLNYSIFTCLGYDYFLNVFKEKESPSSLFIQYNYEDHIWTDEGEKFLYFRTLHEIDFKSENDFTIYVDLHWWDEDENENITSDVIKGTYPLFRHKSKTYRRLKMIRDIFETYDPDTVDESDREEEIDQIRNRLQIPENNFRDMVQKLGFNLEE